MGVSTIGKCVSISHFLLSISHIEIQGRRANDSKHSASWEATQVFLQFPFYSSTFFLLSALSYIGLLFSP